MDRISALRNVEDALADFEDGEATLADLEARVRAVLRTYATELEREGVSVYRASPAEGTDVVVAAADRATARERVREHLDADAVEFDLEQVG